MLCCNLLLFGFHFVFISHTCWKMFSNYEPRLREVEGGLVSAWTYKNYHTRRPNRTSKRSFWRYLDNLNNISNVQVPKKNAANRNKEVKKIFDLINICKYVSQVQVSEGEEKKLLPRKRRRRRAPPPPPKTPPPQPRRRRVSKVKPSLIPSKN